MKLENEQLMRLAPSIFATEPWEQVSERYAFIPTIKVVDALRDEGFVPVVARQTRTRVEGKGEFTKHMLRFRREVDMNIPSVVDGNAHHFFKDAPEIPELVLVNSHDRSSGYQLSAGMWRQVCSNGLMVQSASIAGISIRHSGDVVGEVIEGSYQIINEMPRALDRIERFKHTMLDAQQKEIFATAALELRYPKDESGNQRSPILAPQLLNARRRVDEGNDLWTVFNCVQENFMRGGLKGIATTGRRTRTRKIGSVNEDVRLNKALWTLTEQMEEYMSK